jgi:hypothetical protein
MNLKVIGIRKILKHRLYLFISTMNECSKEALLVGTSFNSNQKIIQIKLLRF